METVFTLVVSVIAVVVAVLAFVESRRLRRIEESRDRREQDRLRRTQAESILTWMSAEIPDAGPTMSVVEVQNRSAAPIFDMEIHSVDLNYFEGQRHGSRALAPLTVKMMPPGHVVYGRGSGTYPWDLGRLPQECDLLRPVTKSQDRRVISVEFTDASGTRWMRDVTGVLREA